ncbi:putative bifunctional diguanylate cyclase/phosphodiesterase [Corallincola platygyrae]|uniref:Bifunctional diguanylate cyclase/phosphodiesterase n=1 Tax=Corallincola platygyrae TaxID=1193278 RepID=A0ABW4XN09_9GAMM
MARKFFSIRWQFSAALVLLLLILISSLHFLSLSQMESQLETQLADATKAQQKTFLTLSELMADRVIEFSDIVMGESDVRELAPAEAKQVISSAVARYWADNHLIWRLESAWLFGANRSLWGAWGKGKQPPPWIWLEEIMVKVNYISRIGCDKSCVYYVGVPVNLGEQGVGALVMTISLMDLVIALRHSHQIDLAIIAERNQYEHEPIGYLGSWQAGISSLSSKDRYLPLLEQVSSRFSLYQLSKHAITVRDKQPVRLSALKISDPVAQLEAGYLVIIDDVSSQEQAITQYKKRSLMLSAFVMLGGLLIGWVPLTHIASRANMLARVMPMVAEQKFTSVRSLLSKKRGIFNDEFSVLDGAAKTLNEQLESLGIQVDKRTRQLEKMAMYDELTGLPNRHLLMQTLREDLNSMAANNLQEAVVLIDLDDFKRVNDTLGHRAGDELLQIMANRLRRRVCQTFFLGRFGGDEFTVLLRLKEGVDLGEELSHLLVEISEPVNLQQQTLVIKSSIGVALAINNEVDPETLIRQADTALYKAKASGRNQFRLFDEDMATEAHQKLAMESELRRAVQEQEFCLFLQPQIQLKTRKLAGFEALIRWRHPEKGMVFPDQFIPQLENSEHIVPVGYWTIEHSMEIIKALEHEGYPGLKIAVNLTSHQFDDKKLPKFISDCLAKYELKAEQIELELTENTLIGDMSEVMSQMQELRDLGVSIAIDDFGTGYSSLEYLRRLPVDILKIDRSFVMELDTDETDRQLVETIIAMASNLRIHVVAEGIEKHEHIEFLAENNCEFGQGYYICRPVDEQKLLISLNQQLVNGRWLG